MGIEGYVAGAGLVDGENGGDQVVAALHAEADQGFWADAPGDQGMGDAVGAGVELGVAESFFCIPHGAIGGRLPDLLREDRGQSPVSRVGNFGSVEPVDNPFKFVFPEEGQLPHPGIYIVQGSTKEGFQPGKEGLDVQGVEAALVVGQLEGEFFPRQNDEGQGIVGCLDALAGGDVKVVFGVFGQPFVHREVFIGKQGFKETCFRPESEPETVSG